jgi:uncharacterized protein YjbJ (UPF0337 family)
LAFASENGNFCAQLLVAACWQLFRFTTAQGSFHAMSSPLIKELVMEWEVIEGNWEQYSRQVKAQWSKLTNDHVTAIAGRRDRLLGQIQESYGVMKDEAERQISAFQKYLRDSRPS